MTDMILLWFIARLINSSDGSCFSDMSELALIAQKPACVIDLIKSESNILGSFYSFVWNSAIRRPSPFIWALSGHVKERKTGTKKQKVAGKRVKATACCYHWNLGREDLVFIVMAERGIQLRFCSGSVLRESQSRRSVGNVRRDAWSDRQKPAVLFVNTAFFMA